MQIYSVVTFWQYLNCTRCFLQGIVRAMEEYRLKMQEHKISVYVRRGGPNYQEGLRKIKEVGKHTVLLVVIHEIPDSIN
jgi:succinyl-CoA synthetase beta subunit